MALFKILKGSSSALGKTGNSTYKATEGYAYFTQDDGKFYIDIADANQAQVGVNRIPLNARAADYLVGTDVAGRNLIQNTLFKDNNNLPNLNGVYHFTPASNCTLTASDAHGLILRETAACQAALYLGSSSNTANANQIKINNLDALAVNTEYTLAFDLDYKLLSGATNSTTYYINLDLYVDKTTAGTFDTTALQSKRVAEITSARKGITVTGTRVEFTFVLPTNVTMLYFRLYCTNTTANQYAAGDFLQLNNIKLERGPVATYWTPAPEDERRYLILNNKTLQLGNSYSLNDLNLASGNGRIFYGTCSTAAGTAAKVVTCADYNQLQTGDILVVSFSNTNTAAVANLTLNVNGKGAKNIKKLYNANIANLTSTNELRAEAIALFVYNGTYWILANADYNNTYSYMFPYENSSTSGAAKQAKIAVGGWKFQLTAGKWFPYTHYYDNTYKGALTLNIGGTGDKPVWINGQPSSSSNYTLPGGNYIVYYDGTNYHFRTDGILSGKVQTGRYFHNVIDYGTSSTPKEILIKTKIPYANGNAMPKLIFHIDNYQPGLPTELGLVFYIYNGEFCNYSATSNTEHRPVITLSSYTENGQEYVAIGLGLIGTAVLPEAYYIHFNIDMFEYWPSNLTRDYSQGWSVIHNTADDTSIIPTEHRVTVSYKDYAAKAGSAAAFTSGTTVKLTGDVTGESSSSTKGWSVATTIGAGKVTNAMLAGSIANNKLANSSITVGNKTISLGGSGTLDDIIKAPTNIGVDSSWDIIATGAYYVASSSAFTGTNNPGTNQNAPYTYGALYVMRAGSGGAVQFYINHHASDAKSKANGIRYRSGWNAVNATDPWRPWATILDDKNYNLYAPTLTGTGASGTWPINITGSAATISTSGGTTAKFWRGDNTWSDTISGGTLKISNHSITLEIGAQNTSWIHFTNSQDKSYYFDHQISAVNGFRVYNTNTTLTNNNLTFANGGGWAMTDETWIRTVGSKSVYMNAGTFRNDGTTQVKLLQHVNANIVADGTWQTGATGTDNSGDDYATRGTLGTSILSIGNATARPAAGTAGGKNNSKGYLRIYGEGTGYGELSYNDSMFASNKSIYLTNTTNSGISNEIRGITATNDYWRVAGGATASNAGYMEIATADDGNEPIYVRQYTGVFSTLKRTATLLDASGNTEFPVQVTAPKFIGALQGNADSATNISSQTPILAASIESNEIKVIDLGNDSPAAGFAQRHAIDFRWYDSHWAIGNLRTGSRPSAGFGFSYSADGTTYNNVAIISNEGEISAKTIAITSTEAESHIKFSRKSWNYITYPNNASSALAIGFGTGDSANQQLVIYKTGLVRPGADNAQDLGDTSHQWKTVYAYKFHGDLDGTATGAKCLVRDDGTNYNLIGLHWFDINGTAGHAAQVNDTPTTAWWHILRMHHSNDNGYYTDLAVPFGSTNHLYYKRLNAGSVVGTRWIRVIDDLGGLFRGNVQFTAANDAISNAANNRISWYTLNSNGTIKTEQAYMAAASNGNVAINALNAILLRPGTGSAMDTASKSLYITQGSIYSYATKTHSLGDASHEFNGVYSTNGTFSDTVHSKVFNNLITGTGTAQQDKGSGVSPRYFPVKWTYNIGRNVADGDTFLIKIPIAGHSWGVYISMNNGTNYYPVVLNGTGRLTTHYPVNNYLWVTFEAAGSAAGMTPIDGADSANAATVTGGVFRVLNYYDSNSTTISNLYIANGNHIATNVIYRYQLLFQVDENHLCALTSTSNVTGTNKTMLTSQEFLLDGLIYYYGSTTTVNEDAAIGAGALYYSYPVDLRYTFNTGTSLTAHKNVYLKVTPTTGRKCKIASANPIVQALPSSNDGNCYILLGRAYNTYCIMLYINHPVYQYTDHLYTVQTDTKILNSAEVKRLIFSDKTAIKHIEFTRTADNSGPSYICYPETGSLAIGFATGYDNTIALFDGKTALRPGKNNEFNLGTASFAWKNLYAGVVNGHVLATHVAGGNSEIKVQYGSTISYWWGVGTGNINHGLYDDKANQWITYAGADNKWTFIGNVTGNADTASILKYHTQLTTKEAVDAFHTNGIGIQAAKVSSIAMNDNDTWNSNDGMIIDIPWHSTYGHQIYIDDSSYQIHHRFGKTVKVDNVNTMSWQPWVKALYTDSRAAVGTATQPIYIDSSGKVIAGTTIGASAYHPDSYFALAGHNHNTVYLKLDGTNNMTADVNIITGDTDKFVNFWYNSNKTAGASWRIGSLGSGTADTNYFAIQSGTSSTSATTWNNTVRIGMNTYDVGLSGNLYPLVTATKDLGTSSLRWNNIYANTLWGTAKHTSAAHWSTSSGSLNGVLKVKIKTKTSWMLAFTIRVYQSYDYTDIGISGYNYGNSMWYEPKAVIIGGTSTDKLTVSFGYDNDAVSNYRTLWVSIPVRSYTGIDVFNVTNGCTQINLYDAFEIIQEATSTGTVQATRDAYRPWYRDETVTNAATATKTGVAGIWLYPENNNEINFGGTNTATTIYVGYRAKDSRAIPTKFIFGSSTGTASLQASTVYLGSSTTSYVSATQYTGNAATASKISAALNQTTKTYLLGTTSALAATAANVSLTGDSGVYLTNTPGELSAYRYSWHYGTTEHAYSAWNDGDECIDFIFV